VGSANLDLRSLNINYEVLLRVEDPNLAAEGYAAFEEDLRRSVRIVPETWRQRGWWNRALERMAGFLLVRLDARFAMRQLSRLKVAKSLRGKH
jgi:cardiolipin synthase